MRKRQNSFFTVAYPSSLRFERRAIIDMIVKTLNLQHSSDAQTHIVVYRCICTKILLYIFTNVIYPSTLATYYPICNLTFQIYDHASENSVYVRCQKYMLLCLTWKLELIN